MDVPRLDTETVSTADKNIEKARLDGIIPQTRRTPTALYNRVAGTQEMNISKSFSMVKDSSFQHFEIAFHVGQCAEKSSLY